MTEKIKVDLSEFTKSAKQHINKEWPRFVVNAFSDIATHAKLAVHQLTRGKFKLHSDYIINGIRSYPDTDSQRSRAESALKRFGDMNAAVYVRPSRAPKKSLGFMADHEFGEDRTAKNKYIAVPTKTLKKRGYRDNKGRVKRSLKPKQLLKRFNAANSYFDGNTSATRGKRNKRRRLPSASFIIQGKSGRPFIARSYKRGGHKKRPLEFLFMFVKRVGIKEDWGMAKKVWSDVGSFAFTTIDKHYKKLPSHK